MSRVLPSQLKYVAFKEDSRYKPITKTSSLGGIICLIDTTPDVPRDIMQLSVDKAPGAGATGGDAAASEEGEPAPPAPFVYQE